MLFTKTIVASGTNGLLKIYLDGGIVYFAKDYVTSDMIEYIYSVNASSYEIINSVIVSKSPEYTNIWPNILAIS